MKIQADEPGKRLLIEETDGRMPLWIIGVARHLDLKDVDSLTIERSAAASPKDRVVLSTVSLPRGVVSFSVVGMPYRRLSGAARA